MERARYRRHHQLTKANTLERTEHRDRAEDSSVALLYFKRKPHRQILARAKLSAGAYLRLPEPFTSCKCQFRCSLSFWRQAYKHHPPNLHAGAQANRQQTVHQLATCRFVFLAVSTIPGASKSRTSRLPRKTILPPFSLSVL